MKKQVFAKKQREMKKIALNRILGLFEQAKNVFNENAALADRYVAIARKISMKLKVRIPCELKRKFCKHCYKYLMPGKNCRIRTHNGKVVYYCVNCKKYMRFVFPGRKKI